MLSENEKTGCRSILRFLGKGLMELVCTLTKKKIESLPSMTVDEAIEVILNKHKHVKDLLSRRKVTKAALQNFCCSAKIPVQGTDWDNKETLVNAIIEYWQPKQTHKKPRITPPFGKQLQANTPLRVQELPVNTPVRLQEMPQSTFPQSHQNQSALNQPTPSHSRPSSTGSQQQDFEVVNRCSFILFCLTLSLLLF